MNDIDEAEAAAAVEEKKPEERIFATAEDFTNAAHKQTRYKDFFSETMGRWVCLRSLQDKVYTAIQASVYKASGVADKVKAQQLTARLIIECVVHPETKMPILTESHIKHLREFDTAVIEELAAAVREHLGTKEEGSAKN